ncbi:MAG: transposase [Candidatus Nitrosocosmicus sp.]
MFKKKKRSHKDINSLPFTIKRIPNALWDMFKRILLKEEPPKMVGRPVVPNRMVLDGIFYILRKGCP